MYKKEKEDVDKNAIIESYKIYSKAADNLMSRRDSIDSAHMPLNCALITLLFTDILMEQKYALVIICLFGIGMNTFAYLKNNQILRLTTAKHDVLIEMETKFPFIFPFLKREWELMKHPKKQKKARKRFLSLTNISRWSYFFTASFYAIRIVFEVPYFVRLVLESF